MGYSVEPGIFHSHSSKYPTPRQWQANEFSPLQLLIDYCFEFVKQIVVIRCSQNFHSKLHSQLTPPTNIFRCKSWLLNRVLYAGVQQLLKNEIINNRPSGQVLIVSGWICIYKSARASLVKKSGKKRKIPGWMGSLNRQKHWNRFGDEWLNLRSNKKRGASHKKCSWIWTRFRDRAEDSERSLLVGSPLEFVDSWAHTKVGGAVHILEPV